MTSQNAVIGIYAFIAATILAGFMYLQFQRRPLRYVAPEANKTDQYTLTHKENVEPSVPLDEKLIAKTRRICRHNNKKTCNRKCASSATSKCPAYEVDETPRSIKTPVSLYRQRPTCGDAPSQQSFPSIASSEKKDTSYPQLKKKVVPTVHSIGSPISPTSRDLGNVRKDDSSSVQKVVFKPSPPTPQLPIQKRTTAQSTPFTRDVSPPAPTPIKTPSTITPKRSPRKPSSFVPVQSKPAIQPTKPTPPKTAVFVPLQPGVQTAGLPVVKEKEPNVSFEEGAFTKKFTANRASPYVPLPATPLKSISPISPHISRTPSPITPPAIPKGTTVWTPAHRLSEAIIPHSSTPVGNTYLPKPEPIQFFKKDVSTFTTPSLIEDIVTSNKSTLTDPQKFILKRVPISSSHPAPSLDNKTVLLTPKKEVKERRSSSNPRLYRNNLWVPRNSVEDSPASSPSS